MSCDACKAWLYDLQTGKQILRGGRAQQRTGPTPCRTCPKQSPEHAKTLVLSEANLQTVLLYLRVRATHGRCLSDAEAADQWLARLLALIDGTIRNWERSEDQALTMAFLEATLANRTR